jgi:hypothetical protein
MNQYYLVSNDIIKEYDINQLSYENKISIDDISIHKHHYQITYLINDNYKNITEIYYDNDIDLTQINDLSEIISFIEILKFMIIFPDIIDISYLKKDISIEMIKCLLKMIPLLWNQHIYENNQSWSGPKFIINKDIYNNHINKVKSNNNNHNMLIFNGGGKDSLLIAKIIEGMNVNYSLFGHSRTEYGKHKEQHIHQDKLSLVLDGKYNHHCYVNDNITDSLFISKYYPHLVGECSEGRPCQVGTPEMLIYSLPYAIKYNYTHFVMGWEESSNENQLYNNKKYVNHQWLKSTEAQNFYNDFLSFIPINDNKIEIISPIRNINDSQLFKLISPMKKEIKYCHSCNIIKPWCFNCPKCMYIWMHYLDIYPKDLVNEIFYDKNYLLSHENIFYELLGIENKNSYECVGTYKESIYSLINIKNKNIIKIPPKIDNYISNYTSPEVYFDIKEISKSIPDNLKISFEKSIQNIVNNI